MQAQLFLGFASQCNSKCLPCVFQKLAPHQLASGIKHKAIPLKKYEEKYKLYQQKVSEITQGLTFLRTRIQETVQQLIYKLNDLREQLYAKIDSLKGKYYKKDETSIDMKDLMKRICKKEISNLTCDKMFQIITMIEPIIKKKDLVEKEKQYLRGQQKDLFEHFESKLSFLLTQNKSNLSMSSGLSTSFNPTIFSSSKSRIQQNSFASSSRQAQFILLELKGKAPKEQVQQVRNMMKKASPKEQITIDSKNKSIEIVEEDHDSDNLYNNKVAPGIFKVYRLKKTEAKYEEEEGCFKKNINILDSLSSMNGSGSEEESLNSFYSIHSQQSQKSKSSKQEILWPADDLECTSDSEDYDDQLNQTLMDIQEEMTRKQHAKPTKSIQFLTIAQIQNIPHDNSPFSTKVQIVKLIYYSVLEKHIPKLKFIAGDHTGFGVFFTNFCPGMKVGTALQMQNCTFHLYKDSLQIDNTMHFKMLRGNHGIKANMKGIRLNKILTKNLYYPLYDGRSVLIRYVSDRLRKRKQNNFYVTRMYVKIVMIISNEGNRVLCSVADSSGMMLAYLKKDRVKDIKEKDVVRLLHVRGCRGILKTGHLGQDQQFYVDGQEPKALVLPHKFDFLQVSEDFMSP